MVEKYDEIKNFFNFCLDEYQDITVDPTQHQFSGKRTLIEKLVTSSQPVGISVTDCLLIEVGGPDPLLMILFLRHEILNNM